jgi:hypothetical protein
MLLISCTLPASFPSPPLLVSLSNHRSAVRRSFDKLRMSGGGSIRHIRVCLAYLGVFRQIIADSARSESFWQRSMLAAWVITPALHSAKLTSRTGSTQNIVLPAP